jgi:anti-sigma B factor antagonist
MEVTVARSVDHDAVVVTLHGDLDLNSADLLRDSLTRLFEQAVTKIVVDLGEVAFCDSVGLSAFILGHRRCQATGGYLRLAAATPFLQRLLAVVGLLGPVPLYNTVAAACAGDATQLTAAP